MKTDMHDDNRRINPSDTACLKPLVEGNMQMLLDELCVLVAVSDMSQSRRQYLVDGIAHLRGHVASELFGLPVPRASRRN